MHTQDGAAPTGPADPTDLARRISLLLQPALDCRVDVPLMLRDALYARDVLLVCEAHRGTELAALALQYRQALAPPRQRPGLEALAQPRPAPRTVGPAPVVPRQLPQRPMAQAPADDAAEPRPHGPPAATPHRPLVPTPANDTLRADPDARLRPPARGEGDSTIARAMRQRAGTPAASPPSDRHVTGTASSLPPSRDSGLSSFFDRFRPSGPASLPAGRNSTRPLTLGLDGPDTWPPEADGPLPEALDPGTTRPAPTADATSAQRPQAPRSAWFSAARWFDRGPR